MPMLSPWLLKLRKAPILPFYSRAIHPLGGTECLDRENLALSKDKTLRSPRMEVRIGLSRLSLHGCWQLRRNASQYTTLPDDNRRGEEHWPVAGNEEVQIHAGFTESASSKVLTRTVRLAKAELRPSDAERVEITVD